MSNEPRANSQEPTAKSQRPTAKGQQPKAKSQRPTAKGQKRKNFTRPLGRWRWVTAAKALGGVDESFGDVPKKLLSEEDIV